MKNPTPTEPTPKTSRLFSFVKNTRLGRFLAVMVLLLLVVTAASAHTLYKELQNSTYATRNILGKPISVVEATSTINSYNSDDFFSPAVSKSFLIKIKADQGTSTVSVIPDQYNLFTLVRFDEISDISLYASFISYIPDGNITSGKYAGYHRIIAQYLSDGPGEPSYYTFATKDYKTFVAYATTPDQVLNPYFVNTAVVTTTDTFPINLPQAIALDESFGMTRGLISTTTPKGAVKLARKLPGLDFYSLPADPETMYSDADFLTVTDKKGSTTQMSANYPSLQKKMMATILSKSSIYVRDESGVGFYYYPGFKRFTDPTKVIVGSRPGLYGGNDYPFDPIEISPNGSDSFNMTYGNLFPYGCGQRGAKDSYIVKEPAAGEVRDTGRSWEGVELFAYSHPESNPIIRTIYEVKKASGFQDLSKEYDTPASKMPSFETYIKKIPTVLFKDSWGRWVVEVEHTYQGANGCGKPVVYLYPPRVMPVSVSFVRVPSFTVDIPTYGSKGWNVIAHPDGTLEDQQPTLSPCDEMDTKKLGSEYARSACKTNKYPYLYWAGQTNGTYPTPDNGWIVSRNDLRSMLKSKLSEVGLNATERDDMLSFWAPTLLKNSAPYFRISFFQTQQMNSFIPMRVVPQPESVLRLFLDWTPLSSIPEVLPVPQKLAPFVRHGFTLVEWGGLERH